MYTRLDTHTHKNIANSIHVFSSCTATHIQQCSGYGAQKRLHFTNEEVESTEAIILYFQLQTCIYVHADGMLDWDAELGC